MTTKSNLLRKENKNFGDFLIMKKTKEKINLIWRNIHSSAAKKRFFHAKKILSNLAVLGFLATLVSCTCADPIAPDPDPDPDPVANSGLLPSFSIGAKGSIVIFPENTVTLRRFINFNITNFITKNEIITNININEISFTTSPGVDAAIADTKDISIDTTTGIVSGSIKLKQRLDFENPIDVDGRLTTVNAGNNYYEIISFNVRSGIFVANFGLFVQITDAAVEPTKIEILVDAYHLATNNEIRGINEFYLYEDANAPDPTTGSDANNFLSGSLVTNPTVIGEVDPSSSIANLYDGDDSTSGFLTATAISRSSKTYHRLTLNFNEKVNIRKLAIRGRQIGGYQGFIFIMRDENDNILYVQRANGPTTEAGGTDTTAISTYSLVPSYVSSLYPISDFDIRINNRYFDIAENTTNVILFDNFSVTRGYEYERGFVSFTDPGADIDKFNTNNVYFLYNELNGIIFKMAPDAESANDADSNNVYEMGMVTIRNVDGGHTNFNLSVRVVNMPSTVSLSSNAITVSIFPTDTAAIADLTEIVIASNFENGLSLGRGTYTYELVGDDADAFEVVGNALVRATSYYESVNYNLQVRYHPENGGAFAELDVSIFVRGLAWKSVIGSTLETPVWADSQTVILANNDFLFMGGSYTPISRVYNNYVSRVPNRGTNAASSSSNYTPPWSARAAFQAVVLPNNNVLVMGGEKGESYGEVYRSDADRFVSRNTSRGLTSEIWQSSNEGRGWSQILATNYWSARTAFQAVVLNGDILVMGGNSTNGTLNDIWRSSDGGANWSQIPASNHWAARAGFQAVVLTNNDVLVMGGWGNSIVMNDIWRSSDGGSNWSQIPASNHWGHRRRFQAVVLNNNDILVMGGLGVGSVREYDNSRNDSWISSDGGTNWIQVQTRNRWKGRHSFQAVVMPFNNNKETLVLVHGGSGAGLNFGLHYVRY